MFKLESWPVEGLKSVCVCLCPSKSQKTNHPSKHKEVNQPQCQKQTALRYFKALPRLITWLDWTWFLFPLQLCLRGVRPFCKNASKSLWTQRLKPSHLLTQYPQFLPGRVNGNSSKEHCPNLCYLHKALRFPTPKQRLRKVSTANKIAASHILQPFVVCQALKHR